ncbi:MAG: 5-formyltetrahydrofolate cyclo-ligase [Firmicutes bacterium]|nr:5-formyltetrahydrofolate cyclo-ligase [Bacillota bacterium]
MDKSRLRSEIRARKRAMRPEEIEEKSRLLGQLLAAHPLYRAAGTIYGYLPYNQEVRTTPMLRRALADGKRVAVPKVYGQRMQFHYLCDFTRVERGYAGIPEPLGDEPVAHDPTALVLLPGLAFDAAGHRMGYGGGFYDRFLAEEPLHPKIALCYDFQMCGEIPVDAHDIAVDAVLWA